MAYDETRKRLTLSGTTPDAYSFILRGVAAPEEVKGASSWNYDKGKKELIIHAEGTEVDIQIS